MKRIFMRLQINLKHFDNRDGRHSPSLLLQLVCRTSLGLIVCLSFFTPLKSQAIFVVGGKKTLYRCIEEKTDFPKMVLSLSRTSGVRLPTLSATFLEQTAESSPIEASQTLPPIEILPGPTHSENFTYQDVQTQGETFSITLEKSTNAVECWNANYIKAHLIFKPNALHTQEQQPILPLEKDLICEKYSMHTHALCYGSP